MYRRILNITYFQTSYLNNPLNNEYLRNFIIVFIGCVIQGVDNIVWFHTLTN